MIDIKAKDVLAIPLTMLIFVSFLSACSGNTDQSPASQATTPPSSDKSPGVNADSAGYGSEIDKTAIMTFEISVNADDWQVMLDNATAEEYISADVSR